jgi:hypothetical protein
MRACSCMSCRPGCGVLIRLWRIGIATFSTRILLLVALWLAQLGETPRALIGPRLRSTEAHNAHSVGEYQNLIVSGATNHQVDREMPWRKRDSYNMHETGISLTDTTKRSRMTKVSE